MDFRLTVVVFLALIVVLVDRGECRPKNRSSVMKCKARKWRGCNIANGRCQCGKIRACTNPFAYTKKRLCKKVARRSCTSVPCMNGGFCMDSTNSVKCFCAGTGYHGERCEIPCVEPNPLDTVIWTYPQACISV